MPLSDRLQALAQLRCEIFQTAWNPSQARTGSKYLKKALKGPRMLNYYEDHSPKFPLRRLQRGMQAAGLQELDVTSLNAGRSSPLDHAEWKKIWEDLPSVQRLALRQPTVRDMRMSILQQRHPHIFKDTVPASDGSTGRTKLIQSNQLAALREMISKSENYELVDIAERQRCEDLAFRRRRGKVAPKKFVLLVPVWTDKSHAKLLRRRKKEVEASPKKKRK